MRRGSHNRISVSLVGERGGRRVGVCVCVWGGGGGGGEIRDRQMK